MMIWAACSTSPATVASRRSGRRSRCTSTSRDDRISEGRLDLGGDGGGDAGHLLELIDARILDRLERAELLDERLPPLRADARHIVKFRLQRRPRPLLAMERDGE